MIRRLYFSKIVIFLTMVTLVWIAVVPSFAEESEMTPPLPDALSEHIVEYHIDVKLDADTYTLHGKQNVTWKNTGDLAVEELYLHLYPNAFESKKSTFMQESDGKLREDQMEKDGRHGAMTIKQIVTSDGTRLLPRSTFVRPDDDNPDDRTLLQVRLTQPVQPYHEITLTIEFDVQLPPVFARMGYAENFVMAGQWFPKLAVYERAGTRGRVAEGWNLHQYHGNSEFYSNFGRYNVTIHVPEHYIVAATGFPTQKAVVQAKMKTYRFYADDVHDFAWAASPLFQYSEQPFSTDHIPGVKIKLYNDPAHADIADRYFYAAKKALEQYSQWYGEYPYSSLSIVVPPSGANGAGGMEYPTLITAWGAEEAMPDYSLERVIVHEIGHQYWYGIVANNEFEEAWLDEGLTSYAEDRVMDHIFGQTPHLPLQASTVTSPAPLKQHAWHYADHSEYADNVYTRAKLVLTDIEQQIGEPMMQRVLRTYFQTWKFRHPGTRDFQDVVEKVTKKDWDLYFKQFVYGGLMRDYAVKSIETKRMMKDGQPTYENVIVVSRHGGFQHKVPIVFAFTDGTIMNQVWESTDEEITYRIYHEAPLQWAIVDPKFANVLDNKHMNNFLRSETNRTWQVRWNTGISGLIEALIGMIAW